MHARDAGPHGVLHQDRYAHAANAISVAMTDLPATTMPYKGNTIKALENIMPMLEQLFDMPDVGPQTGSEQWLKVKKEKIHEAKYTEIAQYEAQLMPAFIKCVCVLLSCLHVRRITRTHTHTHTHARTHAHTRTHALDANFIR